MKGKLAVRILLIILVILIFVFIYMIGIPKLTKKEKADVNNVIIPEESIKEQNNIDEEDRLITKEYTAKDGKVYEIVAILKIPNLNIEYPVLSTASEELLKVSLNKYWGPNPNRVGNFCIIGHNYNNEKFFGNLHKIKKGDIVELTDMSEKTVKYSVYDTYIVDPDDTSCTSQLTNGETEVTLITCTKDFKERFIVKARKNS